MTVKTKVAYRSLGFLAGATAGLLAGFLFKQVWRAVSGEREAPQASDETVGWPEVVAAAAIQGAIFGAVKAAVDRGTAVAVQHSTGEWPG